MRDRVKSWLFFVDRVPIPLLSIQEWERKTGGFFGPAPSGSVAQKLCNDRKIFDRLGFHGRKRRQKLRQKQQQKYEQFPCTCIVLEGKINPCSNLWKDRWQAADRNITVEVVHTPREFTSRVECLMWQSGHCVFLHSLLFFSWGREVSPRLFGLVSR